MKETLEKNKLIAEFMNYEGQHEDWCGNNIVDNDDFQGDFMRPFRPESNWSDLMPVVEKIESLGLTAKIYTGHTTIASRDASFISQKLSDSKIEATYEAVFEFINWYTLSQGEKQL